MSRHLSSSTQISETETSPWYALANAVIEQAAKDYRQAWHGIRGIRKRLKNSESLSPDDMKRLKSQYEECKNSIVEIEAFFRSRWFNFFSNLDGAALLQHLKKDVA